MKMRRDYENCIVTFDGENTTFMTKTGRVLCVKPVYHEDMLYLPLLPDDEWAKNYILKYMSDMFSVLSIRIQPKGDLRQQFLDQGFRDVTETDFIKYRSYYHNHCYMDVIVRMNNTATFTFFVDEVALYKYECIEHEGFVFMRYVELVDKVRSGYAGYALDVMYMCKDMTRIVDLHEKLIDDGYEIIE